MTMTMAEEECEGGRIEVEAEEDPSTETEVDVLHRLVRLSKELCEIGNSVRSDICSAFGKTCIKSVQPKDMIGKGNTKISKEYLAEKILTFVNLTTNLNHIVDGNPPVLDIESHRIATQETAVIKQFVNSFEEKLQKYNSEIESNRKVVTELLTSMQDLQQNMKMSGHSPLGPYEQSAGMMPNTVSPKQTPTPVCEPFIQHMNDVTDIELKQLIKNFVEDSKNEFSSTNPNYNTAYFGKFGYRYSGGSYEAKPMPSVLEKLLEVLRPRLSNPKAVVNSCLIRRFNDGSQYAPPHRDDGLVFDPESEMVSYFVGATRKMKFLSNEETQERDLNLQDGSVLVTSRLSQDFWVHEIEASDATEASYCITFQNVAPYFINSTALIGDSNTRVMRFGEGKGTFGVWMPGKRVEVFHIEDIPEPLKIGPYRNFIIHTGVNNIKRRDRRSNISLVNEMESKCTSILEVYPRARIYISLLLPTKLEPLNYRVKELNGMLIELSHSYRNISIIDHSWSILCDRSGCLKSELGRHDKSSGLPLDTDSLHLGKKGYRILAINIKEGIFGKRRGNIRSNSNQVEGRRLAAGQVQTNGPPRDRLSLR